LSTHQFIGQAPRFYPDVIGPYGSLIALPGDVIDFDDVPGDGLWVPSEAAQNDISGRSWPIRQEPVSATSEAVPEAPEHDPPVVLDPPAFHDPSVPSDQEVS